MKRIALIIDPGTHCNRAIASALQLAITYSAGIVVIPGTFLSSADRVERNRKKSERQLSSAVAAWLRRTLIPFRQHNVSYEIPSSSPLSLADAAPLLQSADLIVMARPLPGINRSGLFTANLFECYEASRTPIHLAGCQSRLLEQIVVNWDGSLEAMESLKRHVYLHDRLKFAYTLVATAATPDKLPLFSAAESLLSSHGRSFSIMGAPAETVELLNRVCGAIVPFELIWGFKGLNIHKNKNLGKIFAYLVANDDIALFCSN